MPFSLGQQWGLQENQLVRCWYPQGDASLVKMMDEEMLGLPPKRGSQLQIQGPALPLGAECAQRSPGALCPSGWGTAVTTADPVLVF